jgi:rhodanese-related sulfurtransferase
LGTTLPACQTAEQILVYCNGGACDDSLQTAIFLRDAGIPRERLFIYAGGIAEWQAKRLPVETGARKSGSIGPGK